MIMTSTSAKDVDSVVAIAIDSSRAKLDIDLTAINRRLERLQQQKSGKSYERQKSALHKLLSSFFVVASNC